MTPELISRALAIRDKLGKEWPERDGHPLAPVSNNLLGYWEMNNWSSTFKAEHAPADRLIAACVRWLMTHGRSIAPDWNGGGCQVGSGTKVDARDPDLLTALIAAVEATNADRSE